LDEVFARISQSPKGENASYQKPIFTFEEISRAFFLKIKTAFLRPFGVSQKVFYISTKEK